MNKEQRIEALQKMIRIKTANWNEEEAASYAQKLFKAGGIDSQFVLFEKCRSGLYAEIGQGQGAVIGVSGHFDVVDAGDESSWTYPPYEAQIVDGRMYGRGTTDMKSGLMAIIIAMIEIHEENPDLKGQIRFLGTPAEEEGLRGAPALVDAGLADNMDALIVAEPSGKDVVVHAAKGGLQGYVHSKGKSAHSSTPEKGINAITQAIKFANRYEEVMAQIIAETDSEILGRPVASITAIAGGNQLNSIPETASVGFNIRTVDNYDTDQFIKRLEDLVAEVNETIEGELTLEVTAALPPIAKPAKNKLSAVIEEVLQRPITYRASTGASDAARFIEAEGNFDLAVWGPGAENTAHQTDEYVVIEDYLNYIDDVKNVLLTYLEKHN